MFMIGFPFLSALALAIFKDDKIRKYITYLSSAAIILNALIFAVTYFTNSSNVVFNGGNDIRLPEKIMEFSEFGIIGVECFLVVLITVLSFKYKKYYAAVLSIAQTALIYWYEFSGNMPSSSNNYIYVDQLTVIMVLIIAIVGTLITVYACGYMHDYHHHHTDIKDRRNYFFALMYIFIGAMFGLVLSNNIIWMYFFWEITSICSFLLIGYTKTQEAINNCFKALWMNLLGGCGFAVGIVWIGMTTGITEIQALMACGQGKQLVLPVMCLAFAALTKSAQLPFSKWLLGAMVAPTPSSALLHSATMVKAGVYLLIRLSPLMTGQISGYMVGLVGGLTFLAMSMLAITVSDGKKVLAYSTLSNLGLITACAGIGTHETVWAAIFLVIFHAVSKALLFQTVGSIEHQTGSRDIETMHGLVRRYPYLTWMLVIGIFGMFLAPFGMLISKWAALKAFVDTGISGGNAILSIVSTILVLCICFGSATTLLYWAKWLATILASNPHDKRHKNTLSLNQWVSLIVHSVMMVSIVFLFPYISSKVVVPYVGSDSQAITKENIYFTIIMIVFIFIIPFATYFLIARNRPFPKADRYFNGVNCGDNIGFVDSFGKEKKEFLTNWYMEDIFGEDKMYKPSVYTSIGVIVVCVVLGFVLGGGF